MNVHDLNKQRPEDPNPYKSLLLLDEIAKGEPLSQRDLSKRLNIALGLVNSYIKNLASKGYVTIKSIPARRYTYYLTPKGFAEKTRLTYRLLQEYTAIYREARRDFQVLFSGLRGQGVRRVVFAGVDEVAEIAYLSLREVDIELAGVVDDRTADQTFFKVVVAPIADVRRIDHDSVIITSFLRREQIFQRLLACGVSRNDIHSIYRIGSDGGRVTRSRVG